MDTEQKSKMNEKKMAYAEVEKNISGIVANYKNYSVILTANEANAHSYILIAIDEKHQLHPLILLVSKAWKF